MAEYSRQGIAQHASNTSDPASGRCHLHYFTAGNDAATFPAATAGRLYSDRSTHRPVRASTGNRYRPGRKSWCPWCQSAAFFYRDGNLASSAGGWLAYCPFWDPVANSVQRRWQLACRVVAGVADCTSRADRFCYQPVQYRCCSQAACRSWRTEQ